MIRIKSESLEAALKARKQGEALVIADGIQLDFDGRTPAERRGVESMFYAEAVYLGLTGRLGMEFMEQQREKVARPDEDERHPVEVLAATLEKIISIPEPPTPKFFRGL